MIGVQSLLRTPDGAFVPVLEADPGDLDEYYLAGAIDLEINGTQIIDTEMWDYVDQLWAYICTMLQDLRSSGTSRTYFPDQPIELKFERLPSSLVLVSIEAGDDIRKVSVDEEGLVERLGCAAKEFFQDMNSLLRQDRYSGELRKIDSILRQ